MSAKTNFKKAVAKAKKLYKTGRYNKFSDAVKAAYKSPGIKKKVSSAMGKAKKHTAKKISPKVVVIAKTGSRLGSVSAGTLAAELRNRLKDSLSKQLMRREMATTKRDRKKIQKQVTATKTQLRKLS